MNGFVPWHGASEALCKHEGAVIDVTTSISEFVILSFTFMFQYFNGSMYMWLK